MKKFRSGAWSAAMVLAVTAAGCELAVPEAERAGTEDDDGRLRVSEALGPTDLESFARAEAPREFSFPRDHGPHPDFRTEWWYLTGNLADLHGRAFGYQATFFRIALAPATGRDSDGPHEHASAWATRQLYMAHFALTDVEAGAFRSFERFQRGAGELAGARSDPLNVWLEDWELRQTTDGEDALPPGLTATIVPDLPPLTLRMTAEDAAIDLRLTATKPVVLHGDRGLSRKSSGNASYYYSSTRIETSGRVRSGSTYYDVEGLSWLDREWSTSVLSEGQVGWDWLSLQLDTGHEVMYFEVRGDTDSGAAASATVSGGTWVEPDGAHRGLSPSEAALRPLGSWVSSRTGITYPSRWTLSVPGEDLTLTLRPLLPEQEFRHTFVYWEGAVMAEGHMHGIPVTARGYVELTGYGASRPPR